jgi:hypothetical protein
MEDVELVESGDHLAKQRAEGHEMARRTTTQGNEEEVRTPFVQGGVNLRKEEDKRKKSLTGE